jgi:hypothetical protein
MAADIDPEDLPDESPAIRELRIRLRQLEGELENLDRQRSQIEEALAGKRHECEALSVAIRSLGGRSETPQHAPEPHIEVRYRGGDRPTIRVIARRRSCRQHPEDQDLLETQAGFKSDWRAAHLSRVAEFIQSARASSRCASTMT